MNTWQSLIHIFYRPGDVFSAQREKRTWGYILLLLVVISIATTLISSGYPGVLGTVSIVFFISFVLPILILAQALYLRAVSATMDLGLKLDCWLTLLVWSMVPGVVCVLLINITIVLTFCWASELLGSNFDMVLRILHGANYPFPSLGFFLNYRYVGEIWTIVLMTIGFRQWSGKGIAVSFLIVIVPVVLIRILAQWLLN